MTKRCLHICFLLAGLPVMILLFACCAESWSPATREELKASLEGMDKKMNAMDHYQVNITHLSYEDHASDLVHEKASGYYRRDKKCYHSLVLGIQSIQNENLRLVVDTVARRIIIGNPDASLERQSSPELRDLAFDRCKSISKSDDKNIRSYRMVFPDDYSLSSCTISSDSQYRLQEILILYNRKVKNTEHKEVKPKMKIIFSEWNESLRFQPGEFSEAPYLIKDGNKYRLTNTYKAYKLIDQRLNIK
jgi:hypothetical protein